MAGVRAMRVAKHPPIRWYTLREAARYVGEGEDRAAARRVRRMLEQRERRLRQKLIRWEGEGNQRRGFVRESVLRERFSERFGQLDYIESVVQVRLRDIQEEIRIARKERKALGARIRKIEKRNREQLERAHPRPA